MGKITRTITVEENVNVNRFAAKSYTVRSGPLWEDQLTAGEALECVASFLFGRGVPYLRTQRQQDYERQRRGHYDADGNWVDPEGVRPYETPPDQFLLPLPGHGTAVWVPYEEEPERMFSGRIVKTRGLIWWPESES